jgi:hypothetical protein
MVGPLSENPEGGPFLLSGARFHELGHRLTTNIHYLAGGAEMKSLKEILLGLCVGGGIILVLSGIGAVRSGNNWWPAYFIAGAIIAVGSLKLSAIIIRQ